MICPVISNHHYENDNVGGTDPASNSLRSNSGLIFIAQLKFCNNGVNEYQSHGLWTDKCKITRTGTALQWLHAKVIDSKSNSPKQKYIFSTENSFYLGMLNVQKLSKKGKKKKKGKAAKH